MLTKLWDVAENPPRDREHQRLSAAAALAFYDPDSPRWNKVQNHVAHDMTAVNPVFLRQWIEAFRPIKDRLLPPLTDIFRDHAPGHSAERALATNILGEYCANQPALLANLLMDAVDRQFCILFPAVNKHAEIARGLFELELTRQAPEPVFKTQGVIDAESDMVKIFDVPETSSLPGKLYQVALKKRKQYTITIESPDIDACIVLQDEAGKQLAFDVDSAGDLNARVDFTAPADQSYRIWAASFAAAMRFGKFSLTVVESDADEKRIRRQANAAVALVKMDQPAKVWQLLKHSPDPRCAAISSTSSVRWTSAAASL